MLLAVAVVLGALLRFFRLGASELSPDEAASWAAAAAPTVAGVIRQQAVFNPGKLAAYELILHGWIAVFGDRSARCARCPQYSESSRSCWCSGLRANF